MSLVRNERPRLAANAFDRASTASIAVGTFAPAASVLTGVASAPIAAHDGLLVGRLALAGPFPILAQLILGRLRP